MNGREILLDSLYVMELRALDVAACHAKVMNGEPETGTLANAVTNLMRGISEYETHVDTFVKGKYARRVLIDAVTSYAAWVAIHNDTSREKRFYLIDLIYDAVEI